MNEMNVINKEKINETINKIINSILFPIIIGILIIIKTIFFYQNTISINEPITIETIIISIIFIATVIVPICLLPNKARVIVTILTDIILTILLFADNLYYIYSSSILSVAQITNIRYGEEIMDTLPMLLQINQIIYFIDIIFFILFKVTKNLKIEKKIQKVKTKKLKVVGISIIMILLFSIDYIYILKGQEDPFNKDIQVKKGTIFGYHIVDIYSTFNIKKLAKYKTKEEMEIEYENLKAEYDKYYGDVNYDLQGIAKEKNIIILQLESLQEFVINKKINDKEITPNINRFINENIEISNMYMQSYSSTADSEFSSITSLYPMENGMSYSRYYTNTYDDIFTMFKNNGYTTSYMHGNYGFFWNRENVYKQFGVEHIELKNQFADTSENIMGYLSDELLYKQAVEKLKQYDNPFITYIVSASSHTSFSLEGLEDRSKIDIDLGKYKDTFFGNYLQAVNYADYAFGVFINELKEANLYDDTIILLFGDHNGIDMYNEEMIDFLKQTDPNITDPEIKLNYIRVACGMKIPSVDGLTIEKPVSKLDIKPTLAYLTDAKEGVGLGTNMFARKDFICLNNERIVTSRYYFDEEWYDIKNGKKIDLSEISEEERKLLEKYYMYMKKELDISISISVNNLLA